MTWTVSVHEPYVIAPEVAAFWAAYLARHHHSGRLTVTPLPSGRRVHIGCQLGEHHARWLALHLVHDGRLPATAVRVHHSHDLAEEATPACLSS